MTFLISKSEVIKKEVRKIRIIDIKPKRIFRERTAGNSFSLALSLENSLVRIFDRPKSNKATNKETKAKAKVNFPYSVTPKTLAI